MLLAKGSQVFVTWIKGLEKKGVFVNGTIIDLDGMLVYVVKLKDKNPKVRAAVLGGGLVGLEAGKALMDMGCTQVAFLLSKLKIDVEVYVLLKN